VQSKTLREKCQVAQNLERQISKLLSEVEQINQREKVSTPVLYDVCNMLTHSFTMLFDMQRFSLMLLMCQNGDKNDFIRCSIVMKNFASYFKSVSSDLNKNVTEISNLIKEKLDKQKKLDNYIAEYEKLCISLEKESENAKKERSDNTIKEDIVNHIANKSESIEELDAELEAENAVGVLKSSEPSTSIYLAYPVAGKIVSEFGDKNADNEMIYYIAFETSPNAIVTSPTQGLVVFSGKFLNYGNMVIISNREYRVFLYGMDVLFAAAGDTVVIGDYIGKMPQKTIINPVIKMELKRFGEPLDPRHWLLETIEKREKDEKKPTE
jgi:murein DD-endopeptidase MepM/ murein hydrolase activator NlpD